jgi:hypothetical protein
VKALTWEQAIAAFGNPFLDLNAEGTAAPEWEAANLVFAHLPAPLPLSWIPGKTVTRFRCHRKVRIPFERAFARVYAVTEAWQSIGDFGGVYALRKQRGSTRPSMHSLGIATDIDVHENPMGHEAHVHPHTIASFEKEGFYWGGRFGDKRIDPMHFEFADLDLLGKG